MEEGFIIKITFKVIKLEDLDKYINQFNFIVLNRSSDYNKVNNIVDKINPIGIYFSVMNLLFHQQDLNLFTLPKVYLIHQTFMLLNVQSSSNN